MTSYLFADGDLFSFSSVFLSVSIIHTHTAESLLNAVVMFNADILAQPVTRLLLVALWPQILRSLKPIQCLFPNDVKKLQQMYKFAIVLTLYYLRWNCKK